LAKRTLASPRVEAARRDEVLSQVRDVMATPDKTYMYHLPLPSRDPVYARYPLEDEAAGALAAAHRRYQEIAARPKSGLPAELIKDIASGIEGILPAAISIAEGKQT
jgi:hypothetical protein